jgi:hypothetical protein
METVRSSVTSVQIYQTTRRHTREHVIFAVTPWGPQIYSLRRWEGDPWFVIREGCVSGPRETISRYNKNSWNRGADISARTRHISQTSALQSQPVPPTNQNSELLYDRRFTANQFVLATSPLRLPISNFIFQLNTCCYSPYVRISSLTTGWVCSLHLLLVLASTVILRSDSRENRDILLFQIRDSPTWRARSPYL